MSNLKDSKDIVPKTPISKDDVLTTFDELAELLIPYFEKLRSIYLEIDKLRDDYSRLNCRTKSFKQALEKVINYMEIHKQLEEISKNMAQKKQEIKDIQDKISQALSKFETMIFINTDKNFLRQIRGMLSALKLPDFDLEETLHFLKIFCADAYISPEEMSMIYDNYNLNNSSYDRLSF